MRSASLPLTRDEFLELAEYCGEISDRGGLIVTDSGVTMAFCPDREHTGWGTLAVSTRSECEPDDRPEIGMLYASYRALTRGGLRVRVPWCSTSPTAMARWMRQIMEHLY